MAKSDESLLQAIVAAVVAGNENGLQLEALRQLFPDVPRRTLQRYLARLARDQRLVAVGNARARAYRVAPGSAGMLSVPMSVPAGVAPAKAPQTARPDSEIPLSDEGAAVLALVGRPLAQRKPVGYRRELLQRYVPNSTTYLSEATREHLHRLGRSFAQDQPAGTYARQILDRLLIDLSWASSRLEGNTYSLLDTQNLIQFGQAPEGKDQLEAQMILNHKSAIEMLVEQAEDIGFNRYTLQNLHALLADNLLPDTAAGGRLRRIEVGISGSVFHPIAIPQQIEALFDELLETARAIQDPFEQAFFAMVQIPYLQPFDDVNKRTSRLAANIPLIKHNLAPLSFVDVPEKLYVAGTLGVYELNRIELLRDVFIWAYERSCQRYTVIRDALPTPNALRLHYHDALRKIVGQVIADGIHRRDRIAIRAVVQTLVPGSDVEDVLAMVINELHQLHEGNIARYRVRPSLFQAWLAAQD